MQNFRREISFPRSQGFSKMYPGADIGTEAEKKIRALLYD